MGLGIVADLLNIVIFFMSIFLMGLVMIQARQGGRAHRRPGRLGRLESPSEAGPATSSPASRSMSP